MADWKTRFWSKVQRGEQNECWPWTAYRNAQGYGLFRLHGAMQRAPRVAISAPEGMIVRHTCDNPACVNPNHLKLGTQQQNIADCTARGRRAKATGEYNNFAKLTPERVAALRSRFAAIGTTPSGRKAYGQAQRLAEEFGITDANLYCIVNRKTWSHV